MTSRFYAFTPTPAYFSVTQSNADAIPPLRDVIYGWPLRDIVYSKNFRRTFSGKCNYAQRFQYSHSLQALFWVFKKKPDMKLFTQFWAKRPRRFVYLREILHSGCSSVLPCRHESYIIGSLSSPAFDPWGEVSPIHVTLPSPPHKNWLSRAVRRSGVIGSLIMQHTPFPWTRSWRCVYTK